MMRVLLFALLLWPAVAGAQSSKVLPGQLELRVEVEDSGHTPFEREMVIITIKGTYRRHITLEKLVQPDFAGFSWSQLGPDMWREERIDGALVKIFERRMALYPDRAGDLTIGAFTHALTLTDEGDDWFEHQISSTPVTITVDPKPAGDGWWFPLRSLQISDQWSNAPDQLEPGEGVLRVIRLEALGATPEMIPPMPELRSPSAMIFPHPEKRLVELTPHGPVTYAFWRWTIRPSNDVSTIVEPLELSYFNTVARQSNAVTISAQRVAYGTLTGATPAGVVQSQAPDEPARLPGLFATLGAVVTFLGGLAIGMWKRRPQLHRIPLFDPLHRQMRRAARLGQAAGVRRAAIAILRRDGPSPAQVEALRDFDLALYVPDRKNFDLRRFCKRFRDAA